MGGKDKALRDKSLGEVNVSPSWPRGDGEGIGSSHCGHVATAEENATLDNVWHLKRNVASGPLRSCVQTVEREEGEAGLGFRE